MDFLFFNAANQPLFTRNDAEQAEWTVEQFSFFGLFPFDPDKVLERGQRVAFQDADGVWQAFEIRKAKSYEPDHYQEITAEHIVVSELTDEHVQPKEWTNQTAQAALASILTGTLWSIGNVTASGTSSGNISYGSVWQGVNTIASNWNVYILPRITIGPSGITGRYLDITPAQGNWRGLRLSITSNLEQAGVTYDDTNLLTAMYGYGKNITPEQNISANPPTPQPQDLPATPLTFTEVAWSETQDHPAKPAGQAYLENPTAKALYGRNGRNRFGFYQNGDVTDPNVLLNLTWKALKKDSEPLISIEGTLHDLQRLGYADQTIRLHDTAIVEILPAGVEVQREIIQLTVDLLNPLNTTVTIGAYIPNIIYINKETAEKASGGGGGGGGGGRGQTDAEKEFSEFQTQISANQYQILLRAWQQNKNNEILRQAGLSIDANGVLVYADDNERNIGSKLKVESDRITQIVQAVGSNGEVTAASIVAAVNSAGSSVVIDADHIDLNGIVTATEFQTAIASLDHVIGDFDVHGSVDVGGTLGTGAINCEGVVECASLDVNGLAVGSVALSNLVNDIGPATASGGQITIPWRRLDGSAGTPINFNIADYVSALIVDGNDVPVSGPRSLAGGSTLTLYPATYINGVTGRNTSAALIITAEDGAGSVTLANYNTGEGSQGATTEEIKFLNKAQSGNSMDVTVGVRLSNGKQYSRTITGITITNTVDGWGISSDPSTGGTIVTVNVNGTTYSHTFSNYP